jgi:outer membrane lipoprotein SlyB
MRSKIVVYKAPAVAAQKPQKAYAAAFAALAMTLAGCATGLGANSYERGSVGTVSRVDEGTIVASRSIVIEGSQTGGMLGGATGAAVGAIAGSQIGGGSDERAIGGVIGAVAGGVLGNTVGNMSTRKPGFAYTVRLRSGELVTITQGGDLAIANGTPVLVEYGDRARVIPQNISIR